MRFVKRVNERGVVTLPNEVREALGVNEGDIVEFEVLRVLKSKNSPPANAAATAAPAPSNASDKAGGSQ